MKRPASKTGTRRRQPKEHIASLVRHLRGRMGLTQERFAQEVGVTFSTVNHWENGKRTPHPYLLQRLLELKGKLDRKGR